MRRLALTVLTLVLVLLPAAAIAAQSIESSDEPINVVADKLEVDDQAHVAHFVGKVKAKQGDVTIRSDQLDVVYDSEGGKSSGPGLSDAGGKVKKVVALGHVKITQKDRVALGRKATYWAGGRKMLLEGQATVWRGKNQVSGEKITVFLDQDRAVVHGQPGKRVSVTIVPNQAKEK